MTLIARASSTVRNKNIIIVVMCVGFCLWFMRDAYIRYPAENDAKVKAILSKDPGNFKPEEWQLAQEWNEKGGWNNVPPQMHEQMQEVIKAEASKVGTEDWHSPLDVRFQRELAWGLVVVSIASIWWFIHCQRRRAIAEEETVSPSPGVVIPWSKITKVDNTRWRTVGIVDITYTDAQGRSRTGHFDDYKLQREALLPILDMLGEKAVNAEFIDPKEESKPADVIADKPTDTPPSASEASAPPKES